MRSISLYYTSGSSNKEYNIQLSGRVGSGNWSVAFQYGRRGSASNSGFKVRDVTEAKATAEFVKLIKAKVGKGYTTDYSGRPYSVSVEQALATAMDTIEIGALPVREPERSLPTVTIPEPEPEPEEAAPARRILWSGRPRPSQTPNILAGLQETLLSQQPNPVDESLIEDLLRDDDFGMQDKYDGKHVMVRVIDGTGQAFNKKGQPILIPPTVMDSVLAAGMDLEIDGELIGQKYVVYDILSKDGKDLRHLDYQNRHVLIPRNFSPKHFGAGIEVAPLYTEEEYKRTRFQEIQAARGEGVVFKRLGASFTVGRPSSGGDFLKFKFYATCSCIVVPSTGNRIGKRSVALGLHSQAGSFTLTPVGNCTIPNKRVAGELIPIPEVGDIIEVRYLYAYPGGSLYQPTYIGPRDDVDEYECLMSQLKYKAED